MHTAHLYTVIVSHTHLRYIITDIWTYIMTHIIYFLALYLWGGIQTDVKERVVFKTRRAHILDNSSLGFYPSLKHIINLIHFQYVF
jgi:hypothetical protein